MLQDFKRFRHSVLLNSLVLYVWLLLLVIELANFLVNGITGQTEAGVLYTEDKMSGFALHNSFVFTVYKLFMS